jgi:CRP-like cAMP-binding protein
MDINSRAAPVSVKAQYPPCATSATFNPIAERASEVIPAGVGKTPENSILLDPSIWLTSLCAGKSQHEYPPDAQVFSQGDPALAVYYVQSGKIQLTVRSEDGEEAVIRIHSEGGFLGECCLADQAVRSTTATAVMHSTLVRLEKQDMMHLLRGDPKFAERFLANMLSRSMCMEADLLSGLFDSSGARLARTRGTTAGFGSEWKAIPVTAKMSPESLAGIVGTTSFNVSFLLDGFRELGFIDSKGDEMLVHSSLRSIVPHGAAYAEDGIHWNADSSLPELQVRALRRTTNG